MILNCEACGKRYMIKDGLIKDKAKKVRCASCGHTWMESPELDVSSERLIPTTGDKITPEVRDNKFLILLYTFIFAVLCSSVILGRYEIVKYFPLADEAYQALGISTKKPGNGLKLQDIHSIAETIKGKQYIYITGTIINTTKEVIHVPVMEFIILGKCGEETPMDQMLSGIGLGPEKINGRCILKSWKFPLVENKLLAGEKVQFESGKEILPANAQSVVIRF